MRKKIMRNKIMLVLFILSISGLCNLCCMNKKNEGHPGTVITSKLMNSLTYIDDDTLVVIDLDGTVWEPLQILGNNAWAYYEGDKYINKYKNQGYKDYVKKGLDEFGDVWRKVQDNVEMKFIDSETATFLKTLKDKNISVIGFTARGMKLVDRTKVQFCNLARRLKLDQLQFNSPMFSNTKSSKFIFKYGILFIGIGVGKGDILIEFLFGNNCKPKKIVFIDDMEKNIKSVSSVCEKNNIECIPVWFQNRCTKLSEKEKKIGDFQLHYLYQYSEVLSDDEAEKKYVKFHYNGGDTKTLGNRKIILEKL